MQLQPRLIPPRPPLIVNSALDDLHRRRIASALTSLSMQSLNYSAGVALWDFGSGQARGMVDAFMQPSQTGPRVITPSEPPDPSLYQAWSRAGARSAVMAAHDYVKVFKELRAVLGENEICRKIIDLRLMKPILKNLTAVFPQSMDARDAVGHPEEFLKQDFSITGEQQGFIGNIPPGVKLVFQDTMHGNQYTSTFKGRVVQCPVSAEAAASLVTITAEIFRVLQPLEARQML